MSLRKWREALRDDTELNRLQKLVGFVLATHAEQDGRTAQVMRGQIAEQISGHPVTVSRATTELEKRGYLVRIERGHGGGCCEGVPSTWVLRSPEPKDQGGTP